MIQLLRNNILLEKIDEELKTKSGLIMHNEAPSRPRHGRVLAVGKGFIKPDGEYHIPETKVGDIILYQPNKTREVKINGDDYLMVDEDSVLGIVKV